MFSMKAAQLNKNPRADNQPKPGKQSVIQSVTGHGNSGESRKRAPGFCRNDSNGNISIRAGVKFRRTLLLFLDIHGFYRLARVLPFS